MINELIEKNIKKNCYKGRKKRDYRNDSSNELGIAKDWGMIQSLDYKSFDKSHWNYSKINSTNIRKWLSHRIHQNI